MSKNCVNVLSVFDGICAGRLALERAGIEINNYYSSEIDKFANKVTESRYPQNIQLGDVTKWREWDIDWSSIDLFIGGSPCFTAGNKVFTDKGYKNIEDIVVGDNVLTHKQNYKKVLRIGGKQSEIIEIKAQGMLPTNTTENHPYMIKRKSENGYRWVKAGELKKGDYICIPRLQEENDIDYLSDEELNILGRYIADGHTRKDLRKEEGRENNRYWQLILSVGSHKTPKYMTKHNVFKHTENTNRIVFNNKKLVEIAESNFGSGASNKYISKLFLDLPKHRLKYLINGLLEGDGSLRGEEYRLTTVSKELAMSLCLAISKVYGVCANIEHTKRKEKHVIQGREVNQKDTYTVSFRKNVKDKSRYLFDDKFIYAPFKSKELLGKKERVYNLEVEEDNTYSINNAIVHNCQGFSVAGKQGGTKAVLNGEEILVTDRGTYLYMKSMNAEFKSQSHLFWEYVLIYDFIKLHNPNVKFMLENVRMKKELLDMISGALGVNDFVINSSLLSAQNRVRHYWFNWEVNKPEDKGILLKDILEYDAIKPVNLINQGKEVFKSDIEKSLCLLSRYYKGFANQPTTGVQYCEKTSEKEAELLSIVNREVRVKQATKTGYIVAEDGDGINLSLPTSKTRRGRVIKQKSPTLETSCNVGVLRIVQIINRKINEYGKRDDYNKNLKKTSCLEVRNVEQKSYCLTTVDKDNIVTNAEMGRHNDIYSRDDIFYRKLTPTECARLQTFPDGWAEEIVSKSQAYKQYGNSWTVDVIAHIFSGVKHELSENVKRRISGIT